jgi:hypothetical protein
VSSKKVLEINTCIAVYISLGRLGYAAISNNPKSANQNHHGSNSDFQQGFTALGNLVGQLYSIR